MDSKKTLDQWVDDKLRDVCHTVGIFAKYLLHPRDEYKKHDTAYINTRIVQYVVEEILNCKILKLESDAFYVPKNATIKVERYLQAYVVDKFTDMDVVYDPDVVEYLWKYISVSVLKLLQGINREDNNAVTRRIQSYRNTISRIGDSDITNCFIKSVCYLAVTLSDWLETPTIGETELEKAVDIIIPKDMPDKMDISSISEKYDEGLESKVSEILKSKYNMRLSSSGKEYLKGVFGLLEYIDNDTDKSSDLYYRYNNRVRYFSQQVVSSNKEVKSEYKPEVKSKIANTGAGVRSPYVDTINTDPTSKVYKLGYGDTTRWMSKKSNKLHSVNDKPAIVRDDGTREWFKHGVRHRDGGPAVKRADETEEWWIDGVQI